MSILISILLAKKVTYIISNNSFNYLIIKSEMRTISDYTFNEKAFLYNNLIE